jgi:hypothetical protein
MDDTTRDLLLFLGTAVAALALLSPWGWGDRSADLPPPAEDGGEPPPQPPTGV